MRHCVSFGHQSRAWTSTVGATPTGHDGRVVSSSREGGLGKSDLYISFRDSGGEWLPLIHMGDQINSELTDYCPMVTPDGKYFFYTQGEDVYWLDAAILETYRSGESTRGPAIRG